MWMYEKFFGLVPLALGTPICITFIVLLCFKRNSPALTARSFDFLILHNIGIVISGGAFCIEILLLPQRNCYFWLWAHSTAFPICLLPFFMRCWIYCLKYYLTQQRKSAHPNLQLLSKLTKLNASKTLWWIYLGISSIHLILPTIFTIYFWFHRNEYYGDELGPNSTFHFGIGSAFCWQIGGAYYFYIILSMLVVVYGTSGLLTMYFLWPSRDAYSIKLELAATFSLYVVGILLCGFSGLRVHGTEIGDIVPQTFWILIVCYLSFAFTGFSTWKLCVEHSKLRIGEVDFHELLSRRNFRDEFSEFLALQFCIENLLFWEAVETFKMNAVTGREQYQLVKDIYETYILFILSVFFSFFARLFTLPTFTLVLM
eukprot:TRINITY_DN7049_c0_g1_i1.p1 TRINITY_DN7049_c0_g1~~TRINITY_DN7049_c0_g1_i1.p1  ORF type:complete len:371 (-),score=22.71 TRINITY_DN7049_c0_g1_i1:115-1227(-)